MSKSNVASLMVLCAALAACADGTTTRTMTAPDAAPAFNEAATDAGFAYTPDGPSDFAIDGEDASAQVAGAQAIGAQPAAASQAASGPRSTGHVGFPAGFLPPSFGLASEKYSYSALRTDPATPEVAKGQFEVSLATLTGIEQRIQGDVTCIVTFGNTARVVGQITKIWRNGVRSPITANTHALWVVVDNGEGAGAATPDQVSFVRFSNATIAQNFCTNGFLSFVFPNQEGNIQVQP